ncbi:MAG: hypothetical protein ACREXR_08670 [Gammaproteobacteria bacterium]
MTDRDRYSLVLSIPLRTIIVQLRGFMAKDFIGTPKYNGLKMLMPGKLARSLSDLGAVARRVGNRGQIFDHSRQIVVTI